MTNLPGKLRPLPSFKDMVEIVRVIRAREVPQFIGFMWCIYDAPRKNATIPQVRAWHTKVRQIQRLPIKFLSV